MAPPEADWKLHALCQSIQIQTWLLKVISFVFVPSIGPFLFFQTLLAVGISGVLVYLPSMVASNMLGLFSSKLHIGVSPI